MNVHEYSVRPPRSVTIFGSTVASTVWSTDARSSAIDSPE